MTRLRTVEEMLERQARHWELRDRMRESAGDTEAADHTLKGPWLTISRQLGSGGTELARRLAHDLHWQAFDHEILKRIAEQTQAREVVLRRFDERSLGPINDFMGQLFDSQLPGRVPFVRELAHVIWGLARQGNAIIVGRGANWLLGAEHGLRVRVIAPFDVRVDRYTHQQQIARSAAERAVRENDLSQRSFIREVYGQDIDDPLGYDIVINTADRTLDVIEPWLLAAARKID